MIIKSFKIVCVDLSRQPPLLVANSNYLCIRHACLVMAPLFAYIREIRTCKVIRRRLMLTNIWSSFVHISQ